MKSDRQLAKYLANLGYGSRKEVEAAIRRGRVTGEGESLRFDGEPVDPAPGMVILMNKPAGFTCSRQDQGNLVYELLPPRYLKRTPALSTVGRLDADTTGLLLFTDDGKLLHKLISPKPGTPKTYEATLARPLEGHEAELFASGALMLRGEDKPLLPATLQITGERTARLTITEGRYHQVRRMFAAAGNHVEALHRASFGPLILGDLPEGEWRLLSAEEISALA
ncbi:pseudouridine synthase [Hyphomonas pacifica]|uniref:Pseudouridine synthase n=1 Tax=Hyphomonas pacifica TaxID=1280941 RepID=A0A062TYC3_9PROT|nr:pseudouridine synthase [Hyphomonas pacifica]KCZ46814.1 pseudouridine synthase [Hyphomonas pacifica]RAN30431.1 pseudouridine synthase [Hyphomonas pacifica]